MTTYSTLWASSTAKMRSASSGRGSAIFEGLASSLGKPPSHLVPGEGEREAFLRSASERTCHMSWIPVSRQAACAEHRFLSHCDHQLAQGRKGRRDKTALDATDCGLCRAGAQRESALAQSESLACGKD